MDGGVVDGGIRERQHQATGGGPADGELIARVGAGDEQALGALYDRYGADAYALATAMVGATDAEDVVAAVFAEVWRAPTRYDAARGTVGAWVATMTRSRALDLLRAQRRRARVLDRAAADETEGLALPMAAVDAADARTERGELREVVGRSLAALPEPQRRVIELAYYGGLSQSAIAAELHEPLGTVKTRMRAGMEKLRQLLRPWMTEEER